MNYKENHSTDDQYKHRKSVLTKYLNIYINKKHITVMKPIMKSIKQRLIDNLCISEKQFRTLIKYLRNDMKDHTDQQLIEFFSPLIYNIRTVDDDDYYSEYFPQLYYSIYPSKHPSLGTLDEFLR